MPKKQSNNRTRPRRIHRPESIKCANRTQPPRGNKSRAPHRHRNSPSPIAVAPKIHCGCSSAGALDLLPGFAPLEPSDGFLAEMTNIPTRIAITIKVSAATTILLKCLRAGRSPILALELIMHLGCWLLA